MQPPSYFWSENGPHLCSLEAQNYSRWRYLEQRSQASWPHLEELLWEITQTNVDLRSNPGGCLSTRRTRNPRKKLSGLAFQSPWQRKQTLRSIKNCSLYRKNFKRFEGSRFDTLHWLGLWLSRPRISQIFQRRCQRHLWGLQLAMDKWEPVNSSSQQEKSKVKFHTPTSETHPAKRRWSYRCHVCWPSFSTFRLGYRTWRLEERREIK